MEFKAISTTCTKECPKCHEILIVEIPIEEVGMDVKCKCGNELWASNVIV